MPWYHPLSVDLIWRVLCRTVLHPFIACAIIPLCLRAEHHAWDTPAMRVAMAWGVAVGLWWAADTLSRRVAYGPPREVGSFGGGTDEDDSDSDNNEVVVVTGGAAGLGRLIAEMYGMRGAAVAALDVAAEAPDGLEDHGVRYYRCDVGDWAQVEAARDAITQELGAPTVLVNNAATLVGKPLLEMSVGEAQRSIATNLLGHVHTLKAFLPGMLGRGGTVVTVSSVLGHLGGARLADYAAAKAGVTALHKSVEAEVAPQKIKMVLVTPGQLGGTALFRGVRGSSAFVAPLVSPLDVAKRVAAAVDAGEGDHIALPLYAAAIDWYNVLPVGLQRVARWLSGVDTGMMGWRGDARGEDARGEDARGEDAKGGSEGAKGKEE